MNHKSMLNESLMKIYHDVYMRWRGVSCRVLWYLCFVITAAIHGSIVITQVSRNLAAQLKIMSGRKTFSTFVEKIHFPSGPSRRVFRELNN